MYRYNYPESNYYRSSASVVQIAESIREHFTSTEGSEMSLADLADLYETHRVSAIANF